MDEHEAYELFTPARERTLPRPQISMSEVYAADARRRRGQRLLAVGGSMAVVVLVVAGSFAATRGGGSRVTAGGPTTPSASSAPAAAPDLLGALRQVAIPEDAVRTSASPSPRATGDTTYIGDYLSQTWTWTTDATPAQAIGAVTAHPPTAMTAGGSGRGTGPGNLTESDTSFTAPETATHSGIELDVTATSHGTGTTTISATAWSVVRAAKPAVARVRGTVESMTGDTSPVGDPTHHTASVSVPAAQAQAIAEVINTALMATATGPHECGPSPQQTVLTFQTTDGEQTFNVACGDLSAGTHGHLVALELPAALPGLLTNALVTVAPAPSFAPTPGIGTLDIGIRMVGGPYPGIDVATAAGTITVTQDGRTVAGGTVISGHRLSVHLPVGTYEVRANGCPAVTAKAGSGSVVQVEARCDIR